MNILLTAATAGEIQPFADWLKSEAQFIDTTTVQLKHLQISLLISGVGSPACAFALGKFFARRPDINLAIQPGVAGTFRKDWELGRVVAVVEEQFADLGAEDRDGAFLDLQALKLLQADEAPYKHGKLLSPNAGAIGFLPTARAITVNMVSGTEKTLWERLVRCNADIESMEGAAFAFACLQEKIPFLQIRSLSNYIEPRNRDNWELAKAIGNLNDTLISLFQKLAS